MKQNFLGNTLFVHEFFEKEKEREIEREIRREGKPQLYKKNKWSVTWAFSGQAVWNHFDLQLSEAGKEQRSPFFFSASQLFSFISYWSKFILQGINSLEFGRPLGKPHLRTTEMA